MLIVITSRVEVVGPGVISKANEGVLERVAERRLSNGWGLAYVRSGAVLVATEDCQLLGKHGLLLTQGVWTNIVVVDCEADVHAGIMESHGLLLDIANRDDLVHKVGWLIFVN